MLADRGRLRGHAETGVLLSLPSSEQAEVSLLAAVEKLADAMSNGTALGDFYAHFGWSSGEVYFEALGEAQVMLVDLDHNDSDDRLAIVLLAYQMASANLARRAKAPTAECTLLLDGRTYENSGLTVWRTVRLAVRLHALLFKRCGLAVAPIFSDAQGALGRAAVYLGSSSATAEAERLAPGSGAELQQGSGPGAIRPNFRGAWADAGAAGQRTVSLWILSGLCNEQAEDVRSGCSSASGGVRFVVFEQAQPAWQSVEVPKDAEVQPNWDWPPATVEAVEKADGAEPSNIRSGERPYPEILDTYLAFQQVVVANPGSFVYVCAALARSDGTLPAPCGQPMWRVSGRPLTVVPGAVYEVKKALDRARAEKAFRRLMEAASSHAGGGAGEGAGPSLHAELCTGSTDDSGRERKELAHILKYGTFMSDAILVALAARPLEALGAAAVVRRLAVVQVSADDCHGVGGGEAAAAAAGEGAEGRGAGGAPRGAAEREVSLTEAVVVTPARSGCLGLPLCSSSDDGAS